ncbi:MAG: hypothetical protein K0S66_1973 [Sphingomonas sp.]|nr:hypothetical protein [Sphingomonas sp.]
MPARTKPDDDDAPLADTLGYARDALNRRWPMLLMVAMLVAAIGAMAVARLTPSYTSTARIRLDPSRSPLAGNPQAQRTELTPEAIETEVSGIRSLELATGIARSSGLFADPEFTGSLDPAATRSLAVPASVLSHLTVDREALAFVLSVRFTSADPVKAATLANAFADGYIDRRTNGKLGTAARQSAWFSSGWRNSVARPLRQRRALRSSAPRQVSSKAARAVGSARSTISRSPHSPAVWPVRNPTRRLRDRISPPRASRSRMAGWTRFPRYSARQ